MEIVCFFVFFGFSGFCFVLFCVFWFFIVACLFLFWNSCFFICYCVFYCSVLNLCLLFLKVFDFLYVEANLFLIFIFMFAKFLGILGILGCSGFLLIFVTFFVVLSFWIRCLKMCLKIFFVAHQEACACVACVFNIVLIVLFSKYVLKNRFRFCFWYCVFTLFRTELRKIFLAWEQFPLFGSLLKQTMFRKQYVSKIFFKKAYQIFSHIKIITQKSCNNNSNTRFVQNRFKPNHKQKYTWIHDREHVVNKTTTTIIKHNKHKAKNTL